VGHPLLRCASQLEDIAPASAHEVVVRPPQSSHSGRLSRDEEQDAINVLHCNGTLQLGGTTGASPLGTRPVLATQTEFARFLFDVSCHLNLHQSPGVRALQRPTWRTWPTVRVYRKNLLRKKSTTPSTAVTRSDPCWFM
jgi:hypothetical protein